MAQHHPCPHWDVSSHNSKPIHWRTVIKLQELRMYLNFLAGWVREVLVKDISDLNGEKRVLIAKVNHSQRLSEKPLIPWVVAEPNGKIIAAHCNCMAGMGETCSHVASLLWACEAGARIRDSMTVTQKSAYWVMPSGIKEIPYSPVKEMEFVGKKRSTTAIETLQFPKGGTSSPSPSTTPRASKSPTPAFEQPTQDEVKDFLASLSKCKTKPAILSLVEPYSNEYIPKSLDDNLPPCLSSLYKMDTILMNYGELLKVCETCDISVTQEQADAVEANTKFQAKSPLWFNMRGGRITASRFKAASRTNLAAPSISLIMSICHPEMNKFKTAALCWGCEHEEVARRKYSESMSLTHHHFKVEESGFFICVEYPFIGASPAGLVTCTCCSDGICEIKCPYCHKDETIDKAVAHDTNFCLSTNDCDELSLKEDHAYYYQVQCQLFCTQRTYCDFVVWTENSVHIERIYPNQSFWLENISKVKQFFVTAVLPELVGKFYSRNTDIMSAHSSSQQISSVSESSEPELPPASDNEPDGGMFCYCGSQENGVMVGCDNPACVYEWFHLECLKLSSPPKSKQWYCPDCRKLPEFRRKTAKKSCT